MPSMQRRYKREPSNKLTFIAAIVGVSFVAVQTRAEWFMIDDSAVGIWTTLAWVSADTVEASFFRTALIVRCTSNSCKRCEDSASSVVTTNVTIGAATDHCPDGHGINNTAF